MISSLRVALVGFSGFERDTLDAYFRLAAKQVGTPTYAVAEETESASLLLVDADLPGASRQVSQMRRVHDSVFVGGKGAPAGAAGWLPRPVDAIQIKRALDDALQTRARRLAEAHLPRHDLRRPGPSARVRQWAGVDHQVSDFRHSVGFSNSVLTEGEPRLDRVLVVTDSPAERQLLHGWLSRLGYRVSVATSGEAALSAAQRRRWGFIFLGLGMMGMDAFQTCRRLKRGRTMPHASGKPVVVVLCPKTSPVDRIRATFSGCDACLTQPLLEDDLLQVLASHDSTFERVFEPTAPLAL